MIFNNSAIFTNGSWGTVWFGLTAYRTVYTSSPWGACGGSGPWDQNDGTVYYSGTITGVSNGNLTMTDSSKTWTTNQFIPSGAPFSAYDTTQGFWAEIASNTATTLTIQGSIPEQTNAFAVSDRYEILRSTVCIDQPGHGAGTNLSGLTPSLTGGVNEGLDPIYQWGDTHSGGNVNTPWSSDTGRIIAYREVYPQASGIQSTSSSPFSCNGSTGGTGWGTLANRPSSCSGACSANSPGCGFFATDQGSQGTLYTWQNGGWATYYQPYTYPHPLESSASSGAPATPGGPAPPTGLTAVPQ
jgi:hypothetical protein